MQNNLQRFIDAQQPVYETVLKELKNANKVSHWMWFIFPQIKGLGLSSTSQFYAIAHLDETIAYLQHPILGKRLLECCEILLAQSHQSAEQIFGGIDSAKLKSSMTLFEQAWKRYHVNQAGVTYTSSMSEKNIFTEVLHQYFHGQQDAKTLACLTR